MKLFEGNHLFAFILEICMLYGLISLTASRENVTRVKFFHAWDGKVSSGGRTLPVEQ